VPTTPLFADLVLFSDVVVALPAVPLLPLPPPERFITDLSLTTNVVPLSRTNFQELSYVSRDPFNIDLASKRLELVECVELMDVEQEVVGVIVDLPQFIE
jgi:hypothetical protein